MDVIENQWNNEAENEVEEINLQRKRIIRHNSSSNSSSSNSSSSSDKDIEVKGGGLDFIESETKPKFEVVIAEKNAEMIIQKEDMEKDTILPASDPPLPEDSTYLTNVTNESGKINVIKENDQEKQELYLENVFEKPPTHGFYCPNCNVCIQKVYIQKVYIQVQPPNDNIRCSSCFSFLIPIGSWLFPGLVSKENDGALTDQVIGSLVNQTNPEINEQTFNVATQHEEPTLSQSVATGTIKQTIKIEDGSGNQTVQIIEDVVILEAGPQKSQAATKKKHFWNNWGVIGGGDSNVSNTKKPETASKEKSDWNVIAPVTQDTLSKQPEIDFENKKQPDLEEIKVDGASTGPSEEVIPTITERTPLLTHSEPHVQTSNKTLEIVKSIVYGGLTELLASLSVVTSAASADATTLNIVALAIANLIGGLFALGHNLKELKSDQPKRSNTNEVVDKYNELLGQRENFILHAFIAILSFIIFGLVPPIVYGFTFQEGDEKDFKLAAVAGASLLCITLLSIAKTYIKRPNSYLTYFQTVFYYVSTGAVASVLSYVAGDMVKKLIQRLGLFEPTSKFGWGSY